MKLWRNNRIDAEYEMTARQIAEGFLESAWATQFWYRGWPLDRALRAYITSPHDGLGSVFDDRTEYERVYQLVLTLHQKAEQ